MNAVALVGHNTVRASAVGAEQRAPTPAELEQMRGDVERAMEQGACGFSTGLIYRPGRYSTTEEVAATVFQMCCDDFSYVTGIEVFITGGQHLY